MRVITSTTNKALFNQYYSTSNVVTRNSILGTLESRAERGDVIADGYVHGIVQTKALSPNILPPGLDETFLSDEELLFLATHLMAPDDIKAYGLHGEKTGSFELDGKIYDCTDETITVDAQPIVPTPEFLVRVMRQYDPVNSYTISKLWLVIDSLIAQTPFTALSFIREVMRIRQYITSTMLDNHLQLHDCPSEQVRRALITIDMYGTDNINRVMTGSLIQRIMNRSVTPYSGLKIKRTITRGLYLSDPHLHGITLLINADNRYKEVDEYTLIVDESKFERIDSDWGERTALDPFTHLSLHLLNLSRTILTGFESSLSDQVKLNAQELFDVFIYDSKNLNSVVALSIAIQSCHLRYNYDYQFLDIHETIYAPTFMNKRVCTLECDCPKDLAHLMTIHGGHLVSLVTQDDCAVVQKTWNYFIGYVQPPIIKIFGEEGFQEFLKRLTVLKDDDKTVLQRIAPFISTIMRNLSADVTTPDCESLIDKLIQY